MPGSFEAGVDRGSPPAFDAESLLEHASWMRDLARRLVERDDRADDLAQEVWVKALEHPPRPGPTLRGWLATVARNLARADRRAGSRRSQRELESVRASERSTTDADPLDLVLRLGAQRELASALLELEEPYRTTLLLRYFEDRSVRWIASHQRVPVATVKTRLARGIARLRTRLEPRLGPDGRTGVLALLPLIAQSPASSLPPVLVGVLAVNLKLTLVALLLAVAGVSYFLFSRPSSELERAPALAAEPTPALSEPRPSTLPAARPAELPAPSQASRVEITPERASETAPAPASESTVRGRVIDVVARPIAGVAIGVRLTDDETLRIDAPGSTSAPVTAADGSFSIAADDARGRLTVLDESWATVLEGKPVRPGSDQESLIVVAPRIELSGVVLDEFGLPIEGAVVRLVAPSDLRARLSAVLDFSVDVHLSTVSDARGRFALSAAPAIAGATLGAEAKDFQPHEQEAPLVSRADLVLTCERPVLTSSLLEGRVLDPAGAPVEGARVSLGVDATKSDADGRFSFRLDDPESFNARIAAENIRIDRGILLAVKPGYLPAELRARGRREDGEPIWPADVVLRLGSDPLVIAGSVVDADGEPLAGIHVWLANPTFFGGIIDEREPNGFPHLTHVENELAGAQPGWHRVESDEDGAFVIEGVLERDYVLAAMDPETLLRVEMKDVPGGDENVVITFPADAVYPVLRGKIVDARGAPVESARVFPMCDAFQTRLGGNVVSTQHDAAESTLTDAEGVFELPNVPRDLVYLRIEADDTVPLEWGRHVTGGLAKLVGEKAEELVITVGRRCHFQVELDLADEADEIAVLDAAGNELEISEFIGSGRREGMRQPLTGGRSNMLAVADTAAWLVLYRQEAEVRRLPLALVPGEPTMVRP